MLEETTPHPGQHSPTPHGSLGRALTESEDFSECPLSLRTAKDAVLERQPSSRHTPSHLTVWLVLHTGNCRRGREGHQWVWAPEQPTTFFCVSDSAKSARARRALCHLVPLALL